MTTPDPTAVRKDAVELSESALAWIVHEDDPDYRDAENYRWWQLQSRVADAYLAEHDPTPLTVEVLVGMGGERLSAVAVRLGCFQIDCGGNCESWLW